MASIPSGWTDDMNIALASHHTLGAVVDLVISSGRAHTPVATMQRALIETFGLTDDDAALAWDRVHGGIVRAATGNVANRPDKSKDPLAWTSFQLATEDRTIIAALYPQYANPTRTLSDSERKPRWRFWR
jgi:hypothetical protein